jgi:tetratricopeptide (TPR) repeat protein
MTTPLSPFQDFGYTWPTLSYFLSTRDIQSMACTSSAINASLKWGIVESFFTEMSFRQKEQVALSFEKFASLLRYSPYRSLFMGEVYRIQGLYRKAIIQFENLVIDSILSTPTFRPIVMTAKAMSALWRGNSELAASLLEESFKLNPEYTPTLLYRYNLLRNEQQEKALSCIQKVLKRDPGNLLAQVRMADALFYGIGQESNQEQGKALLLNTLMNCRGKSAYSLHIKMKLAEFCVEQKNFSAALEHLRRCLVHGAIQDTTLYPKIHLTIADIFLSKDYPRTFQGTFQDKQSAYESLEKASCTNHIADLYTIAELFVHKNLGHKIDVTKAVQVCRRILVLEPCHEPACKLLQELLHVSADTNENSKKLCEKYFLLNFQEQRNRAKKIQKEARKLVHTEHRFLAYCSLGESFLVLGEGKKAYNYFAQLTPWVEDFQENTLFANDIPPEEFYFLSRYALFLLDNGTENFSFGSELLSQARIFNSKDALVECITLTIEKGWNSPTKIERVFLLDPTNLTVAYHATNTLLRKKGISTEIYQMLDHHLTRILELYPEETTLMLLLATTKSKIPDYDKQSLWELYTKVIELGGGSGGKDYAEAVIRKAKLFFSSGPHSFPGYEVSRVDQDLLQVYESKVFPEHLMRCATMYTEYAEYFEQAHSKALKFALKAYMLLPSPDEDIREFIGALYEKGGLGIIRSYKIARMWKNGVDLNLSYKECLSYAGRWFETNPAEAAFYFTMAFMQIPGEKGQQRLLSASKE